MTESPFTVDAARALGGPDWLVARRTAAAEQLVEIGWPSSTEEIWRYSPIDRFDIGRYRPRGEEQRRVVLPTIDPALEAKGVVVGDLRTVEDPEIQTWFGSCSDASPDAFTLLHDAFVGGGVYVKIPAGVVVEEPIVVEHLTAGNGLASFPHTLVVAGEHVDVTVLDRYAADGSDHLCDAVIEILVGDGAQVRYTSVQQHGPSVWQVALQRAHVGRDASLQSSAIALG